MNCDSIASRYVWSIIETLPIGHRRTFHPRSNEFLSVSTDEPVVMEPRIAHKVDDGFLELIALSERGFLRCKK